jgi:glutamate racemase
MIGIFDSGSGGLTVLKAVREQMPSSDILYFGDIKNAPYGSKSNSELSALTVHAIGLLQERGAGSIVSACNSVSASLAVSLFDVLMVAPDHLIEMVGPAVAAFKGSEERLLLVATPATIRSEIYQNAFHMIGKEVEAIAIPDLAAAIEFGHPEEEIEKMVRSTFADVQLDEFDVLILACTHYPLVQHLFEKVCSGLRIYDPALAVGERAKRELAAHEVGNGTTRFLISQDSQPFRDRVAELPVTGEVSIEVIQ